MCKYLIILFLQPNWLSIWQCLTIVIPSLLFYTVFTKKWRWRGFELFDAFFFRIKYFFSLWKEKFWVNFYLLCPLHYRQRVNFNSWHPLFCKDVKFKTRVVSKEKSFISGKYLYISAYQNFCQAKPVSLKILLHFFSRPGAVNLFRWMIRSSLCSLPVPHKPYKF